ncbi:hypothetical protein SRABI118_05021 [Massilia sp. Bi118]|nr:hypothetical protein SRABI118_05021 [Massilia sp. Bi118]
MGAGVGQPARFAALAHQGAGIDAVAPQFHLAGQDAAHVQQVVDDAGQVPDLAPADLARMGGQLRLHAGQVEHLDRAGDGRQRIAQLVAQHREEGVLGMTLGLGLAPRLLFAAQQGFALVLQSLARGALACKVGAGVAQALEQHVDFGHHSRCRRRLGAAGQRLGGHARLVERYRQALGQEHGDGDRQPHHAQQGQRRIQGRSARLRLDLGRRHADGQRPAAQRRAGVDAVDVDAVMGRVAQHAVRLAPRRLVELGAHRLAGEFLGIAVACDRDAVGIEDGDDPAAADGLVLEYPAEVVGVEHLAHDIGLAIGARHRHVDRDRGPVSQDADEVAGHARLLRFVDLADPLRRIRGQRRAPGHQGVQHGRAAGVHQQGPGLGRGAVHGAGLAVQLGEVVAAQGFGADDAAQRSFGDGYLAVDRQRPGAAGLLHAADARFAFGVQQPR